MLSLWNVQIKVSLSWSCWGWSDSNFSTCSENKRKVWVTRPIIKYHTQTRWQRDCDLQRDPLLNTAVLFLLYSEKSSYKCYCCQISKRLSSMDCLLSEMLSDPSVLSYRDGMCLADYSPQEPIQRLCPCTSSKQAKRLLVQLDIKLPTKQLSIKNANLEKLILVLQHVSFDLPGAIFCFPVGFLTKKAHSTFYPRAPVSECAHTAPPFWPTADPSTSHMSGYLSNTQKMSTDFMRSFIFITLSKYLNMFYCIDVTTARQQWSKDFHGQDSGLRTMDSTLGLIDLFLLWSWWQKKVLVLYSLTWCKLQRVS